MQSFKSALRGHNESDADDFRQEALASLSKAAHEISYLIDHGYPRDPTLAFVGNRYQFSQRQRLLLARTVSGSHAAEDRAKRLIGPQALAGCDVAIDGFNAIITLEVALSGSPVILGEDGTLRDLAGLRGTYRIIDKTPMAIRLIIEELQRRSVRSAHFYIDAPVSNSGTLRSLIEELGSSSDMDVRASTEADVDHLLYGCKHVVSTDSAILDHCSSWINLDATIAAQLEGCWLVDIWN